MVSIAVPANSSCLDSRERNSIKRERLDKSVSMASCNNAGLNFLECRARDLRVAWRRAASFSKSSAIRAVLTVDRMRLNLIYSESSRSADFKVVIGGIRSVSYPESRSKFLRYTGKPLGLKN